MPDILPGHDVWDHWPVLNEDGTVANIAGGCLMIALTAVKEADPEGRHQMARMRLFHLIASKWDDLGPLLPAELSPGTREWAGSATLSSTGNKLKLFFTATGCRGVPSASFAQRLFEAEASVSIEAGRVAVTDWQPPRQSVAADGVLYQSDMVGGGEVGTIKAFRDPFFFRAATGEEYLLFTGSNPKISSAWNGVIGTARKSEGEWRLLPPLVRADDLNNELERPHVIENDGRPYLFWSTQQKVFKPGGPTGPTGLYGIVADKWGGSWRPLNGGGLVFGNPKSAPFQAYSFQVNADLSVRSFADMPEMQSIPAGMTERRHAFSGGPAPVLQLWLDGDDAGLTDPAIWT